MSWHKVGKVWQHSIHESEGSLEGTWSAQRETWGNMWRVHERYEWTEVTYRSNPILNQTELDTTSWGKAWKEGFTLLLSNYTLFLEFHHNSNTISIRTVENDYIRDGTGMYCTRVPTVDCNPALISSFKSCRFSQINQYPGSAQHRLLAQDKPRVPPRRRWTWRGEGRNPGQTSCDARPAIRHLRG